MARTLLVVTLCLGVAAVSAHAAGPQDMDAVMRHYDRSGVPSDKIHVSTDGDLAYVRGTAPGTPWLDVWRRTAGEWKLVAEMVANELAPIRFGKKRSVRCS
jgi:hypothetical protein